MLSFFDYFYANLNMYLVLMISVFLSAYIFVIVLEHYFKITLKNPVGKIPKMKNPVGRIPKMKNPMRK